MTQSKHSGMVNLVEGMLPAAATKSTGVGSKGCVFMGHLISEKWFSDLPKDNSISTAQYFNQIVLPYGTYRHMDF